MSDYKEVLAEGATEIARRSPIIAVLVLETLAILWIGWQIVSGNLEERDALRTQNATLTEQLILCYQSCGRTRADHGNIVDRILLSAYSDTPANTRTIPAINAPSRAAAK